MPRNPFSPRVYYFCSDEWLNGEEIFGTTRKSAASKIRESSDSFIAIFDSSVYLGSRIDNTNWSVTCYTPKYDGAVRLSSARLLEDYINLDLAIAHGFRINLILNRIHDLSQLVIAWTKINNSRVEFLYNEQKNILGILVECLEFEIRLKTHSLYIGPSDFSRVVNWLENTLITHRSFLDKCNEFPLPFLQRIGSEFFKGPIFNGKRNMNRYLQFCRFYMSNEFIFHQFGCESAYFGVQEFNNWIDILSLVGKHTYKYINMKGISFISTRDFITCKIAGCVEIPILNGQIEELKNYYDGSSYQIVILRLVCFILFFLKVSNQYDTFTSRLFRMSLSS